MCYFSFFIAVADPLLYVNASEWEIINLDVLKSIKDFPSLDFSLLVVSYCC